MKVLTLRIYNSTPEYDQMYILHKENDPNSIFLTASSDLSEPIYNPETRILTVPGIESLVPGILQKTIHGIRYCLEKFEFDILIRSNLSTIIDYTELTKHVENIQNSYGGHTWTFNLYGSMCEFVSGCCITMSKSICKYLCDNMSSLNWAIPDDVAIGYLVSSRYPITFRSKYVQTQIRIPNTIFYRFRRDLSTREHREADIQDMKHLYSLENR